MSTISIHIEGHEDGALDDPHDLAVVLRWIADDLPNSIRYNPIPPEVVTPAGDDPDPVDMDDYAQWSVQYSLY